MLKHIQKGNREWENTKLSNKRTPQSRKFWRFLKEVQ